MRPLLVFSNSRELSLITVFPVKCVCTLQTGSSAWRRRKQEKRRGAVWKEEKDEKNPHSVGPSQHSSRRLCEKYFPTVWILHPDDKIKPLEPHKFQKLMLTPFDPDIWQNQQHLSETKANFLQIIEQFHFNSLSAWWIRNWLDARTQGVVVSQVETS